MKKIVLIVLVILAVIVLVTPRRGGNNRRHSSAVRRSRHHRHDAHDHKKRVKDDDVQTRWNRFDGAGSQSPKCDCSKCFNGSRNTVIPAAERPRASNGMKYLQQFGYMKHGRSSGAFEMSVDGSGGPMTPAKLMSDAIKKFQRLAHIEQTGILDEDTLDMMEKPRCGVPDDKVFESDTREKRYVTHSSKWEKTSLTYNISGFTKDLDQAVVEKDIADALNFWASVTPLTFTKVYKGKADIDIYFANSDHGDGSPFDMQGGVLAHAFFPTGAVEFDIAGDTHFDDGEDWTHGKQRGSNLLYAAVHEFGHALGLHHSEQFNSVMYPFARRYDPNLKLYQDDIDGIQSLYGSNTPEPTSTTTEPTTTKEVTTEPATEPTTQQSTTETPRPTKPPTSTKQLTTETTEPSKRTDTTTEMLTDPQKPGTDVPTTESPDSCVNTMDAITVTVLGDTVAFRGSQIYVLSVSSYGVQEGYPKPIFAMFPDGPNAVDAALTFPHYKPGKEYKTGEYSYTWLFKGDKNWKYKNVGGAMVLEAGYPRYIYIDWGILGIRDRRPSEGIDSAFIWGNTGNVYFTKGNQYWKYNGIRRKVLNGYPKLTTRIPVLRRAGITEVDAAFQWINDRIYFFKDGQYHRYERGNKNLVGPKDTGKYWFGCPDPSE